MDKFSIGQVSERTGVSPTTIRDWEKRGDIPPAQRVGIAAVRLWGPDDVAKIERRAEERRAAQSGKAA